MDNKNRWIDKYIDSRNKNLIKNQRSMLNSILEKSYWKIVLNRIIESIGCGNLIKPSIDRNRYTLFVSNIPDLLNIIIPLFENHFIYGAKYEDFFIFAKEYSL